MITFTIKKFSDLCGNCWWEKKELEPAPKFDEIKKSYDKVQKMLDNLIEKNMCYLKHVITQYGVESYNANAEEYYLTVGKIEFNRYGHTIFVDIDNDINEFKYLPLETQMELIEKVNAHVQTLTSRHSIKK